MARSEGSTCIDDEMLAAFAGGLLAREQVAAIQAHLASCDECLAIVAAAGASQPALAPTVATPRWEPILDRYEVVSFLARGGMGAVYLGRDVQTGQSVAIKCLEPQLADLRPEVVARFEREGEILRRLDHPNIVKLLAVSGQGEGRQIVMEYVSGGSLRELLRDGRRGESPLSIERAVGIALELSDALSRAHHLGVIHRDIKPENILLTEHGTPRLSDFGLAKLGDRERTPLTDTGAMVGTLPYQCPEALHGQACDARADVWALGVVLFEMVTGRRPFVAPSAAALLKAILHEPLPDLAQLRPGAPRALTRLIASMLQKNPASRPASMRQIGAALEAIAFQRPERIESVRDTEPPAPPCWVGRIAELERLERIVSSCIAGKGRVVLVTGEAGAGKTAIVNELLRRTRRGAPQLRIGAGHCLEQFGPREAYAPFLEAIGALLEGDRVEENESGTFAAALERFAPTWCLQFPAHFSAPERCERLQRVTLGAGRERMLRELGDALVAFSREVPLCLRLEDLHWTDPASVDILRLLCRRAAEGHLLVIATLRTDQVDAASPALSALSLERHAHQTCEEVSVGPLAPEDVEAYLDRSFSPNDFAPELSLLLIQKTEGHALYTTRLVQHLRERALIAATPQGYRLARPPRELDLDIPESVRALIRSKLDSLGALDQRILASASVEGAEFTQSLLARVLDLDELALESALQRLSTSHGLIQPLKQEFRLAGKVTRRYRFGHVLYQDVLYGELSPTQKEILHRTTALLLLEQQTTGERMAVRIATHFERGGEATRAIELWLVAGDQATQAYAYREAVACHDRALALLDQVPVEKRPSLSGRIRRKRAWARFHLLDVDGARDEFERVLELARSASDHALEGDALNALSHLAIHAHAPGEMEERAQEALRVAEVSGDEGVALIARAQLAGGRLWAEPGTEQALEPVVQRARAIAHGPALALALALQGLVYGARSQHERAERLVTESLRYPTELREPLFTIGLLQAIGGARAHLGRVGAALSSYEEALDLSRRNGTPFGVLSSLTKLAWLHRELGDVASAARLAAESGASRLHLEEDTNGPRMVNATFTLCDLFEAEGNAVICFGERWRRAPMGEVATQAFEQVEAWQQRISWWHWLLRARLDVHRAQSALTRGDFAAAERHARAALERASTYGAARHAAIAHRLIAEVAAERSELTRAQAELELGLGWLSRAPSPLVGWKLEASMARVRWALGDTTGAGEARARAEVVVRDIARHIRDSRQRETFVAETADPLRDAGRGA